MRLLATILLLGLLLIVAQVGNGQANRDNDTSEPENKAFDDAVGVMLYRIDIPQRFYIYKSFSSLLIESESDFEKFFRKLDRIAQRRFQDVGRRVSFYKKAHTEFRDALKQKTIEYDKNVLLLLRNTEGSGSPQVWVETPRLVDEELVFKVKRSRPMMRTADMAYYCYAYVVPRGIAKRIRVVGAKDLILVAEDGSSSRNPTPLEEIVLPISSSEQHNGKSVESMRESVD